tara:strand:- start:421 stop:1020 length:600 start_codon:yes stop_codon:yes gene_type:complete
MDEVEVLQHCWHTCLELIKDRNYDYDDVYNNLSDEEFKYLISSNNLNIIGKNLNNVLYIKFITLNKIKSSYIKDTINDIRKKIGNISNDIILVLKAKPTSIISKIEKDKDFPNIQIMHIKQLSFNPTKHCLVPKHSKISENEVNKIFNRYSINSKNQLPIILKEDPIVRYYNFSVGDVIKIDTCLGSYNTNYNNYRCVR